MLEAIEYLGKVGVGVTSPEFYKADDQCVYVVKRMSNTVGKRVLISEFCSALLGKKLGLNFPPSDTITLETLLPSTSTRPTRHFASRYMPNCLYATSDNILQAKNLKQMAGIILYDHMFHNADRTNNRKNILLSVDHTPPMIYAIDNSHLFRTGRWTIDTLKSLSTQINLYPNYLYGVLLKKHLFPEDFEPYLTMIKQLSTKEIDCVIDELPEEWFDDAAIKPALREFIVCRCSMIADIYAEILKKIPEARGGTAIAVSPHLPGSQWNIQNHGNL